MRAQAWAKVITWSGLLLVVVVLVLLFTGQLGSYEIGPIKVVSKDKPAVTVIYVTIASQPITAQANNNSPITTSSITEPPVTVPTAISRLPTNTPLPPPDTKPGSILEIGQTWRQGGLQLKLTDRILTPNAKTIITRFTLLNTTEQEKVITFGPENFTAVDNQGHRLITGGIQGGGWNQLQATCFEDTILLRPQFWFNVNFACESEYGQPDGLAIQADISNRTLTEVIVAADGISTISNARWRIPINH